MKWSVLLAVGVVWAASYFGSRVVLETLELDQHWRIAVALAPVSPFAAFLGLVIVAFNDADELHRRVQLEALGIAFPLAILLLMVLGLLQLVIELSEEDWGYRHVWTFLPMFYFIGLAIAWRRYR
jgi:hypothetical protein